jgi:hypothetical protein
MLQAALDVADVQHELKRLLGQRIEHGAQRVLLQRRIGRIADEAEGKGFVKGDAG